MFPPPPPPPPPRICHLKDGHNPPPHNRSYGHNPPPYSMQNLSKRLGHKAETLCITQTDVKDYDTCTNNCFLIAVAAQTTHRLEATNKSKDLQQTDQISHPLNFSTF